MFRRMIIVGLVTIAAAHVHAQSGQDPVPEYKININRQLSHENIDKEQALLLAADGSKNKTFTNDNISDDASHIITQAILHDIDWLQYQIETSNDYDARMKMGYLLGVVDILREMKYGWQKKQIKGLQFPQIISLYKKLISVNQKKESLVPYVEMFPYHVAYAATVPKIFAENESYKGLEDILMVKYSQQYPEKTLPFLVNKSQLPSVVKVLKTVGHKFPEQLYSYAQANDALARKIKSINDDAFVQTIVKLSQQNSGQIYFPFIDNLVSGKITIEQINAVKDDRFKYYRLLVNTQIDYTHRAVNGDTAVGFENLTAWVSKKAREEFVNEINALHELPDAVRYKCLEPLTAEELYYLAVFGDGLIYTSSYTSGVFPRMLQKTNNRGDLLLLRLGFDHYRKFISQAASYNTLKKFFETFQNSADTKALMTTFVTGLEKSDRLEDGVDVADSYASLYETLPDLAKEMLNNIKKNLDKNIAAKNKKGVAIYNILHELFLSANPANKVDLTKELGIPPIYNVPFKQLANEKGEIITQMFFYGDDDGKLDFDILLNTFNGGNWSVDTRNDKFVVVKSTSGVPVYIYANRPLPNEQNQDFVAQTALEEYLAKNNLKPTITFHRGHSYHANTTIDFMAPTSRIVFMGSCGGYSLIDSILSKSEDAHIISSKQIGKRDINKPFIVLMAEKLRQKKDIDWIPFWKEFRANAQITGLEDYMPPYKNLGALFIKAFRKEMGEEDV